MVEEDPVEPDLLITEENPADLLYLLDAVIEPLEAIPPSPKERFDKFKKESS